MKTVQQIKKSPGVNGDIRVPGDKSISHRSIMLGSLAQGTTHVQGFLQGEDNLATLQAFRQMGIEIEEKGGGELLIMGKGLHGLSEPENILDCGNSGTTARLMTGLLSGQSFFSVMTGDQYLRKRPMKRVVKPLMEMGARISGRDDGSLMPLAIQGGGIRPVTYHSPIASAQVKSAIMLAGLYAQGETSVYEPHLSRDHSERMFAYFGADVKPFVGGVTVTGLPDLGAREVVIPGDISSAAFPMVAALITPSSELMIRGVGVNPTRSGIIDILQQMGGQLELLNQREVSGEPVADILVKSSRLKGIEIGGAVIPRAIDEFPVIAVAAAMAEGETKIRDARELRVKETDRIAAVATGLRTLGVAVEEFEEGMTITGTESFTGGDVDSCGDHRIAMSMAIAGLNSRKPVTISGTECTRTSFPGFWELIHQIAGYGSA